MIEIPSTRIVGAGESRTHDPIARIILLATCVTLAILGKQRGLRGFAPGSWGTFYCKQLDAKVRFRSDDENVLHNALADRLPLQVELRIKQWSASSEAPPKDVISNRIGFLVARAAASVFLEFYEVYKQVAYASFGRTADWPAVWKFGRLARNTIGHGGILRDEGLSQPISWHKLTFSKAEEGRNIFDNVDLMIGDFVILMLEMSDELHAAGCKAIII